MAELDNERGHRLLSRDAANGRHGRIDLHKNDHVLCASWKALGSLMIVLVMFLPLLDFTLSGQRDLHPRQLAIELHPEKHASRNKKTLEFRWNVTMGTASPDGVEKSVYLVNGAFPGPTIEARSGDRIVVRVLNSLESEGVAIHWHGLRMRDFNAMDGAVGFTQCPIAVGDTFTYDFTIGDDEHGTFWWHSHSQLQRADGLYGGFVVHLPGVDSSQREALLLVGDWFHRRQSEILDWYSDWGSLGNEPVPDSLLVNGRGRYDCSMAVPARPLVCKQKSNRDVLPLLHGKPAIQSLKLRLVNTGTVAGFTVSAEAATIKPVAIDGGFAISIDAGRSIGILYPGERVDVVLTCSKADASSIRLHVLLDQENFGSLSNPALNPHHTFNVFGGSRSEESQTMFPSAPADEQRKLGDAVALTPTPVLPQRARETLLLYLKTQLLARHQNKPLGFVNNTSWKPQKLPLLATERRTWDHDQLILFIPSNERLYDVDIIINNLDDGSHPIHLHGHSFYVLASHRAEGRHGWGSYNPYEEQPSVPFNMVNPVLKDTVNVPRRGHVVIRVKADNPGIWMMHCHMLVHMSTGMVTGLHVGAKDDMDHLHVDTTAASLCR